MLPQPMNGSNQHEYDAAFPVVEDSEQKRTAAIRRVQAASLAAAIASAKAGNVEPLESLITGVSAKRRSTAEKQWREYRLWRRDGETLPSGVITPERRVYEIRECSEKVYGMRYPTTVSFSVTEGCEDQYYCDELNKAAREFGLPRRAVTKHWNIRRLLCSALFGGEIVWVPAAGGGWETTLPGELAEGGMVA